jgi:hypothetical protein
MTPIINPWAIYLISRLDTIKTALAISIILIFFLTTMFVLISLSEGESWENLKKAGVRKLYILIGILLIINCFLPDAKTGVMILTTHYLTQETFDKGMEFVEKTTDHIIDKAKELNNN